MMIEGPVSGALVVSGGAVKVWKQANFVPHVTYCEIHQKKAFKKDAAKRAIHNMPDRKGMREYWCEPLDLWHVGHLPQVVLDGQLSAADVYRRRFTP